MTKLTLISNENFTISANDVKTTSLNVAVAFGKRHDNLLKKLESIDCSDKFNALNFKVVEYIDAKGEKRPMWEMTKDGFMFLVMGFTGKKAAGVKESYITAFNRMSARIRQAERRRLLSLHTGRGQDKIIRENREKQKQSENLKHLIDFQQAEIDWNTSKLKFQKELVDGASYEPHQLSPDMKRKCHELLKMAQMTVH